jgi:hypothetical protein
VERISTADEVSMCESCGVAGETPGESEILDDEEV